MKLGIERGTWSGGLDWMKVGHWDWRLKRNDEGWGMHTEEDEEDADVDWRIEKTVMERRRRSEEAIEG